MKRRPRSAAAAGLADQGRHEAAVQAADPLTLLSSDQLLPGEDGGWLEPYRSQADAVALQALELVARSAGALGDHHLAAEAGRARSRRTRWTSGRTGS